MKFLSKISTLILFVGLTSCGGGGSSSTSESDGTINRTGASVQAPDRNILFVADAGSGDIATFPVLNPVTGTTLQGNVLTSSLLFGPGLAYDARRDHLYVATQHIQTEGIRILTDESRIVVFDRASELTGKITPSRTIRPIISNISRIVGIFLDKERNTLYVAVDLVIGSAVAVFNNVSTLNGDVVPTRLITNVPPGNIAIDTKRSILYIEEYGTSGGWIIVYPNLETLNGVVPFSNRKIIRMKQSVNATGLAIDSDRDRLYIGEEGVGVRILDHASTAYVDDDGTKNVTQTDTVLAVLPNVPQYRNAALAFDPSNDRLYAGFGNAVYVLNAVSNLNTNSTVTNALAATFPTESIISSFAFP